jgi:outer membrane protein TolC
MKLALFENLFSFLLAFFLDCRALQSKARNDGNRNKNSHLKIAPLTKTPSLTAPSKQSKTKPLAAQTTTKSSLRALAKQSSIIFFTLLLTTNSFAQNISQKEIVESSLKHYPLILSNYQKIQAAKGSMLASKGFFDITLKQNYQNQTRGFYDGSLSETRLEKNLGYLNAKAFTGFRKSFDDFANYDGDKTTNDNGELFAGLKLSLLRNATIDENRLLVQVAQLEVKDAELQMQKIKMQIARDAKIAYWQAKAAAKIYEIYKNLFDLSLTRQAQLEEKARKGAIAQIIVVENRKNILKRKTLLAKARQEFENRSLFLSLFYRDENGLPKLIKLKDFPPVNFHLQEISKEKLKQDVEFALNSRPEINLIKNEKNIATQQLKFADNLYKPQLDVEFGVSKDRGGNDFDKRASENFVNLDFSIPLQQRQARGESAKASSKIKSLEFELQLAQEQIVVSLEQLAISIENISEIFDNLQEESSLAQKLEEAERERFKQGASNFFLVNMREQDTADAKASLFEIFAKYQETVASYEFASFKQQDF